MSEIIVVGHRNPDTDSACAAWSYARFKNTVDPQRHYKAAVCGQLGTQAKFVFANAGLEPPVYVKDVRPRVADILSDGGIRLGSNDPLKMAFEDLDTPQISVVPVFDEGEAFAGVVGVHEMLRYLLEGNVTERPLYTFRADNIEKVIPGYFLRRADAEFRAPIMAGAMDLEQSTLRLDSLAPAKPIMICGNRPDIITLAISRAVPAIILTGYKVGEVPRHRLRQLRRVGLCVDRRHVGNNPHAAPLAAGQADHAPRAAVPGARRAVRRRQEGRFSTPSTTACRCSRTTSSSASSRGASFLEKPKRKLILVDHNELSQAIAGAEDAEIVEIIDHHRMGAEKTTTPIYIYSKPIGSTCSIVYSHFRMAGVEPDRGTALLMLSGLLSDTMLLRSPTTTPEDRLYAPELARLAGVDLDEYGTLMLSKVASLRKADPQQIVKGDFKEYAEGGYTIGVSQLEVGTLVEMDDAKANILAALDAAKRERNLSWALLMITDIVREHSVLLCSEWPRAEKELPYKQLEAHIFDLPGVLSRKKQLLPEILRIVEVMRQG